ncbi:MAG: carboxypeptidase regulatory-like domain-containing protein [Bacteroidetes bacterium]|nr:carboxypeptidase regulatory-like domain-containing protein [Bacteroidota bacterium]
MKTTFKITTIAVTLISSFFLNGCSKKEDPVKPNNTQTTGDATLTGEIQLARAEKKDYNIVDEDWDGIKVELLGTQLYAETDIHGKWKISGIDSGSYSVRFTKSGFDTLQLDNIVLKSQDSIRLLQTIKDSTGTLSQSYDILFLAELPSKVEYLSGNAKILQKIVEIKDSHDTTQIIKQDTLYTLQSDFTIKHTSQFAYTENYNNVRYMFCLSEKQNLDQSEIPLTFSPWKAWQNEPTGFVKVPGKEGVNQGSIRTFYVNNNSQINSIELNLPEYVNKRNIAFRYGMPLYIHVIYNWGGMKRVINQDKKAVWTVAGPVEFYSPIQTIPIEWK